MAEKFFKLSILPLYISESYDQVEDHELFEHRVQAVAETGFNGIELAVRDPELIELEPFRELLKRNGVEVAAIGTGRAYGVDGLSFIHPELEVRRKAVERVKGHIRLSRAVGCPPVIIGLIRGKVMPGMEKEAAEELLLAALGECAVYAGEYGVGIALEPINRYETNLIHSVDQGLELLDKLQSDHVGLLLDTFHMNIEEASIEKSILKAAGKIRHFHVADSNRLAPGWGHLDFGSILRSLEQTGYNGYVSGESYHPPDALSAIKQTHDYMRLMEREVWNAVK